MAGSGDGADGDGVQARKQRDAVGNEANHGAVVDGRPGAAQRRDAPRIRAGGRRRQFAPRRPSTGPPAAARTTSGRSDSTPAARTRPTTRGSAGGPAYRPSPAPASSSPPAAGRSRELPKTTWKLFTTCSICRTMYVRLLHDCIEGWSACWRSDVHLSPGRGEHTPAPGSARLRVGVNGGVKGHTPARRRATGRTGRPGRGASGKRPCRACAEGGSACEEERAESWKDARHQRRCRVQGAKGAWDAGRAEVGPAGFGGRCRRPRDGLLVRPRHHRWAGPLHGAGRVDARGASLER